MKITTLGIIAAFKNIGMFLATFALADIKADLGQFCFAFLIYACVSIPSDLYLLNHASESGKKKE